MRSGQGDAIVHLADITGQREIVFLVGLHLRYLLMEHIRDFLQVSHQLVKII
jgi:hypothetical protein